MDPTRQAGWRSDPRLPRTRGDGPGSVTSGKSWITAPPHPRGWTPPPRLGALVKPGSPAPAGMDPSDAVMQVLVSGLPRTRGDGPVTVLPDVPITTAPPHPRGWTHMCTQLGLS